MQAELQVRESTSRPKVKRKAQGLERLQLVMADDDDTEHMMMMMAAQEAGLHADFEFCDDGAALLVHLERMLASGELPDALILDLRMPRLNGMQTLERLKVHPELWKIPVVVFSSSTRPVDREGSEARGAHWFRSKPSDFDAMVDFVRSLTDLASLGAGFAGSTDGADAESPDVSAGDIGDVGEMGDIVGTVEQALRAFRSPSTSQPTSRH